MGVRWAEYVGKRVLYGVGYWKPSPYEGTVDEVSPSESYVKICGNWYREGELIFLEALGEPRRREEA
ncbi:MAG: hypothetical protein LUO93_09585 [Methanomicrobiales archaeon]|nr:hypothetical protein [Methanomicrobiales archaeon]